MLTPLLLVLLAGEPWPPGHHQPIQSPKHAEHIQSLGRAMLRARIAAVPQIVSGFTITNISLANGQVTLSWNQGTPIFQVWGTPDLSGPWSTVGPLTLAPTVTFPTNQTRFFRIQGNLLAPFTADPINQPRLTWQNPDLAMGDTIQSPIRVYKRSTRPPSPDDPADFSSPWVLDQTIADPSALSIPDSSPTPVWYKLDMTTAFGYRIPHQEPSLSNQAAGSVVWAKRFGSTGTDYVTALVTTSDGSIFVTGIFSGTVDFGNGHVLTSAGGYDVFVAKYDSLGNAQWVTQIGGTSSEVSTSIVLDSTGNIFVGGTLIGGSLAKLNSVGAVQWIKGPDPANLGTNNTFKINGMAVDSLDNIVCTGYFVGGSTPIHFGNGHDLQSGSGSTDAFVAKYDTSGNCLWARNFANWGDTEIGTAVAVDFRDNTIIVAGYAYSGISLVQSGVTAPTSGDMENGAYGAYGYLGRLQADGSYNAGASSPSWERMVGTKLSSDPTAAFCKIQKMTLDSNHDIVVACDWNYTANFGANAGDAAGGKITDSSPFNDMALAKYNISTGKFVWVRPITGHAGGSGSLITDSQNSVFFVGSFTGTMNFGNVVLTPPNVAGTDMTSDCFVAKYDVNGNPIWAKQFGGTDNDSGTSVGLDPSSNPVVGGAFNNNLDGSAAPFGPANTLTSAGVQDGFLMKLLP